MYSLFQFTMSFWLSQDDKESIISPPGIESTNEPFNLLISWYLYVYLYMYLLYVSFFFLVKESDSDKQSEPGADCAEQDIGCWSQKWSARY